MDISSLIPALIFGLPYGYYLSLLTRYDVLDNVDRMFYASSPQMFSSFYDANHNGFNSYSYFHKTNVPRLTYLRAFEKFDEETAFKEYKKLIVSGIKVFFRRLIAHVLVILVLGLVIFAQPTYFYSIVFGYYVVRLTTIFVNQYRNRTCLLVMCGDFVPFVFRYAYGDAETESLLKSDPTIQGFPSVTATEQEYPSG